MNLDFAYGNEGLHTYMGVSWICIIMLLVNEKVC